VLKQDPVNREVVYAGTTEGLYKTVDGGKSFKRMTGPDVIVNDVFVDPHDSSACSAGHRSQRRSVELTRGASFMAANEGFSGAQGGGAAGGQRQSRAAVCRAWSTTRSYGGVFVSSEWRRAAGSTSARGWNGRDVFALAQAPDGTILAGTNHGIFALGSDGRVRVGRRATRFRIR
jgi:hypothetical protein